MKVFLAGCEQTAFLELLPLIDYKNILFSYYHWSPKPDAEKTNLVKISNENKMEVICDSGLFTLMFGVGKGGNYDLNFMTDYTKKYLERTKTIGINNLTIVESDVHKLLGMSAVFELRKLFEDSGRRVLYVWHKEEGIDGLMRMAEKYDYIAISVPELRVLFKDNKTRYQNIVHQLLQQIRKHCNSKPPKIHLLGNTVQETMETSLAYSCDSTSWLSGGRFGTVIDFRNGRLTTMKRTSDRFCVWEKQVLPKYGQLFQIIENKCAHNLKYKSYQTSNLYSAISMKRYQEHLDKNYRFIGKESQVDL